MLRFGVVLVVLACGVVALASQSRSSGPALVQHTCGLTDRQFIANYQVQLEAVGMYGSDFMHGSAAGAEVISAAGDAAEAVRSSAPFDPSLRVVRRYAPVMFLQYAAAVRAREHGKSGANEMYLAFTVGARVQETLRDAKPGLAAAGCDISDLL